MLTTQWPYQDPELDRLREMERRAIIEEEKQQIRERLIRRGINPDWPAIPIPSPFLPRINPRIPLGYPLKINRTPTVEDVFKALR